MNYANHNLRTELQEWKNRLYRSTYSQFEHQLKFLLNNFESNYQIKYLLEDAITAYPYTDDEIDKLSDKIDRGQTINFENEIHQASFNLQLIKFLINHSSSYDLTRYMMFTDRDFERSKSKIVEEYISPILYYLHDKLDRANSTIFLLEKYKKRTEWFTKKGLFEKYTSAEKSYEQIFEDDLRLFLFDQGIDYPFSTPTSSSGRVDIIGEIETDNPLIVEIKIFDRQRGYGKDRIKDGFNQIVKYANDYNKDVGYLVIYNMDKAEINFRLNNNNKIFPPSICFNNKTFYFVIINAGVHVSASKSGTLEEIVISEDELTK